MNHLIEIRKGTYPPAHPNWEGCLLCDGFDNFPFEESLGFSPLGETGEGSLGVN